MNLTSSELETIQQVAYDLDIRVYEDYSGRSMFGRTCLGLVVSDHIGQVVRFFVRLGYLDENLQENLLDAQMRHDDLGMDTIVYFPDVAVERDED